MEPGDQNLDYTLGREVHYRRRINLVKTPNDNDKKTGITQDSRDNVRNVKQTITLREVKKTIREPQKKLEVFMLQCILYLVNTKLLVIITKHHLVLR